MRKYYAIKVKNNNGENVDFSYDMFYIRTDKYSKDEAVALFKPVAKENIENNSPYCQIVYEYNGEEFHAVEYCGIVDEDEIETPQKLK